MQNDEYARRINRVMNHISANYASELTLEELAGVACFSPYHFHRIFRALTGETLGSFIRRVRLEKAAKRLIFDRKQPITEIALDHGFSSSQNFAKAFKLHFGISPTQARAVYDHPDFYSKSGNTRRKLGKDLIAEIVYFGSTEGQPFEINLQRSKSMNVAVKEMEPVRVAYFRNIGAYSPELIGPCFQKLMAWAGPRGLIDGKNLVMGASWDDPSVTPEQNCRYDACISLPEGFEPDDQVSVRTMDGGQYAIYRCEVFDNRFDIPWTELMRDWLPNSGYQPDDKPSIEIYYNDASQDLYGKWICDLCLPVKPL